MSSFTIVVHQFISTAVSGCFHLASSLPKGLPNWILVLFLLKSWINTEITREISRQWRRQPHRRCRRRGVGGCSVSSSTHRRRPLCPLLPPKTLPLCSSFARWSGCYARSCAGEDMPERRTARHPRLVASPAARRPSRSASELRPRPRCWLEPAFHSAIRPPRRPSRRDRGGEEGEDRGESPETVLFTGRQKTAASVTGGLSFMLSSTTPGSPGLLSLDGWEGSSPSESPPCRRPRIDSAFCFGPSAAAADRPPLCHEEVTPPLGSAAVNADRSSTTQSSCVSTRETTCG